jgi:hypothetical protein
MLDNNNSNQNEKSEHQTVSRFIEQSMFLEY